MLWMSLHLRLNFIWPSLLWPYNKLLVTIYSSKDKYTNGRDRILGAFYTGVVFSSFMTNYSESYIEDLRVLLNRGLQTAEPVEPVEPAEPVEAAEPVEPKERAEPAELAEPAEPIFFSKNPKRK